MAFAAEAPAAVFLPPGVDFNSTSAPSASEYVYPLAASKSSSSYVISITSASCPRPCALRLPSSAPAHPFSDLTAALDPEALPAPDALFGGLPGEFRFTSRAALPVVASLPPAASLPCGARYRETCAHKRPTCHSRWGESRRERKLAKQTARADLGGHAMMVARRLMQPVRQIILHLP